MKKPVQEKNICIISIANKNALNKVKFESQSWLRRWKWTNCWKFERWFFQLFGLSQTLFVNETLILIWRPKNLAVQLIVQSSTCIIASIFKARDDIQVTKIYFSLLWIGQRAKPLKRAGFLDSMLRILSINLGLFLFVASFKSIQSLLNILCGFRINVTQIGYHG